MPHKLPPLLSKIPTIGIFCFILLFLYATSLYPGGSQANIHTIGFDWINNYWCNLMNEKGMNGMPNPARPIAISAMIILCSSLSIFFYLFATFFAQSPLCKFLIKFGGSFSMFFAIFIFTDYHDLMTILSSIFGVFAVIGILKEVYVSSLTFYKVSGIVCLLLLGTNNIIYYAQIGIPWLPLLQKITFLIVLLWIVGLNHLLDIRATNN